MDIFRWIIGSVAGVLLLAWLLFFVLALLRDDRRQQEAATRLRQWAQLVIMSWVNIEIWGRVVYTIATWPG